MQQPTVAANCHLISAANDNVRAGPSGCCLFACAFGLFDFGVAAAAAADDSGGGGGGDAAAAIGSATSTAGYLTLLTAGLGAGT